jgi:hypothetical protein
VAERRDLAEQLREDVLARDQELGWLDSGVRRRLDQVLALDREQASLDAVLAPREKLPDEPELLVLARLDQGSAPQASRGIRERGSRARPNP